MLSENIKRYRKNQNLSQEELAVRLYVVRQTISKWENGLSVPDAHQLIQLADALGVVVSDLLDTPMTEPVSHEAIAQELAALNRELAELTQADLIRTAQNKVRGCIIFLSFITIILNGIIRHEVLAIASTALLLLIIMGIFYKNMTLLAISGTKTVKTRSIRIMTLFNIALFLGLAGFVILVKTGTLNLAQSQEKWFQVGLAAGLIIFFGIMAPRLPFNRHTGLRLPWTVTDELAWNLAHKVLGMTALPLAIGYLILAYFYDNITRLSIIALFTWIATGGIISLLYVIRKRFQA